MPRGVPHEHRIKSEARDGDGHLIDQVWALYDDEGNELATHVDLFGRVYPEPADASVHVRHRWLRHAVWGFAAGAVSATFLETFIHWH